MACSIFLHFWLFVLSGEGVKMKINLPESGLEPGTSSTELCRALLVRIKEGELSARVVSVVWWISH